MVNKILLQSIQRNTKWIILVGLILIMFLGAIFRLNDLGKKSLWVDEFASIRDSESITSAVNGAQPPLYYLILHFFRYLGTNEFILRLPSAIFGILTIFVMYKLGKLIGNTQTGLISSFLLSISTFHIYYSQEARMYALLGFLSVCSFFLFYKSIKENKRIFWFGFIISTILTIFSHYFGIFVLFVEIVFVLVLFLTSRFIARNSDWSKISIRIGRKTFLIFTLCLVIISLFFAPFFLARFGSPSISPTDPDIDLSTAEPLELSFIEKLFGQFSNGSPLGYDIVTLYLFVSISVFGFIFFFEKNKEPSILILLWLIIPIILLFWASTLPFVIRESPVYPEPRYLIFVQPVYLLIISLGIYGLAKTAVSIMVTLIRKRSNIIWIKNFRKYVTLFIILIFSATCITPLFEYYNNEKQDWRHVSQHLQSSVRENDVFVIEPNYFSSPLLYYFENPKNEDLKFIYGSISSLRNIHDLNERVWLITSRSQNTLEITNWADSNSLWKKNFDGGLSLYFIPGSSSLLYNAAIITNTTLTQYYIHWWKTLLTSGGFSTLIFDEKTILSEIDLNDFDLVLFIDVNRPFTDVERSYLKKSIEEGANVMFSGISPAWVAGGSSNLFSIKEWFGAATFSEVPAEERIDVKFTKNSLEIMDLDTNSEYAFYTSSDWSTPTAALVEDESFVYAYRVNDEAATIFTHEFGNGTVIFNGLRYSFWSDDAYTSQYFIQKLLQKIIE